MATRFRNFIPLKGIFNLKHPNIHKNFIQRSDVLFFSTKSKSNSFSRAAMLVGGLGLGGGLYGYLAAPDRKNRPDNIILSEKRDYLLKTEIPIIEPSREVQGLVTDFDLDLTLYQYQSCPFCCKVRAFLNFYGIPYNVIEVNPVMRKQLKFSEYKKVPILIAKNKTTNDKFQLNDSSVIVSILGTYLNDPKEKFEDVLQYYVPYIYNDENGKKVEEVLNTYFLMYGEKIAKGRNDESMKKEREWRKWADKELVHILSPNVYRTFDEALQAFNYFSEVGEWEKNFSSLERMFVIYVGALAMYFVGKRLKKRHALKDDVRGSLYDACNTWLKAVGPKQKFLGGDVPNLADLAVYGLLNSIEGCTAFADLLSQTKIGTWYYNVKEAVTNHAGYKMIN